MAWKEDSLLDAGALTEAEAAEQQQQQQQLVAAAAALAAAALSGQGGGGPGGNELSAEVRERDWRRRDCPLSTQLIIREKMSHYFAHNRPARRTARRWCARTDPRWRRWPT